MTAAAPLSSPPFRLLAACARWPRGAERDTGVRDAVALAGPDWPAFLAMVRRHRMAPIALDGLVCAGIVPPDELKALAGRDVRQALGLCAEAARLQALFAAEGIAMVSSSGPKVRAAWPETNAQLEAATGFTSCSWWSARALSRRARSRRRICMAS